MENHQKIMNLAIMTVLKLTPNFHVISMKSLIENFLKKSKPYKMCIFMIRIPSRRDLSNSDGLYRETQRTCLISKNSSV